MFSISIDEDDFFINISPNNIYDEIIQNIKMILTTTKGSVPLNRDFGLSGKFIDRPIEIAKALMANEIIKEIKKYENRAEVKKITFKTNTTSGKIIPTVYIEIIGDEND